MDQTPFIMASVKRPWFSRLSARTRFIRALRLPMEMLLCCWRSPERTKSREVLAEMGSNLYLRAVSPVLINLLKVESGSFLRHSSGVVG